MNMDDFLDKVDDSSFANEDKITGSAKNSLKMHSSGTTSSKNKSPIETKIPETGSDEIDFLNESLSQGWDEQVTTLVAQINQSIAEDEYDIAIQKYMELKELPSKIIESDLKTQARLKQELQVSHEKLTVHMKTIEAKHSEQTAQLKQLISFALDELRNGKDEVASDLYLKACQLYNTLPGEFQARNVKLHYDILKLYFAIKEAHDLHEDAKQSDFVMNFTNTYNEALGAVKNNVLLARQIHDDLHNNVMALPNEEIKLKSELLEQLVFLRNQISVVESKQPQMPSVAPPLPPAVSKVEMQSKQPTQVLPKLEEPTSQATLSPQQVEASTAQRRAREVNNVEKTFSQPKVVPKQVVESKAFTKKKTPLVEKKQTVVEETVSEKPTVPDGLKTTETVASSDPIQKLRAIPENPGKQGKHVVASDAHLESLQQRAKRIKARLQTLHHDLDV